MTTRFRLLLFTVASVLLFPAGLRAAAAPPASGSPEAAAIARHVAWLGGWSALDSLQDVTFTGTLEVSGLSGSITSVARRDGYSRTDYDLKVVQGGEVLTPGDAWTIGPGNQVTTMGAARAEDSRRILARTFGSHLRGEGVTISYPGTQEHAGGTYEVVRFTYPNGDLDELFLDPASGQEEWERTLVDTAETWTRYADWRVVQGLRMPFHQESTSADGSRQVLTWTSVAANSAPSSARFVRPGAAAPSVRIVSGAAATDWTPVDLYEHAYIYLHGTVNGVETDMVLDSGAGMTVLDRAFAAKLGLQPQGDVPAVGAGGTSTASMVNGVSLRVAGLAADSLTAVVIDMSGVEKALGRPMPVIFGNHAFNDLIVDLDYPGARIRFLDPASFRYEGAGHRVELFPTQGGHREVEAQVEDLPPARFHLDTGNGGTLNLFSAYTDDHKLLEGRSPVSEALGGGVGGVAPQKVATLRGFTIGGYTLREVPATFSVAEGSAGDTRRQAGNLGAGILSRFRVLFDFGHDALWLEAGDGWDRTPFRRNRTGLSLRMVDDGLEVTFVAPGSPAEKAGWKRGETVTAVDGKAIDPATYSAAGDGWNSRACGTDVALTMRGGEVRTLRLADYY